MARPKKNQISLNQAISSALKGETSPTRGNKTDFNLEKFKQSKFLAENNKFKEQTWISVSPALQEIISLPGIPEGHITLLRGHSDTGKTTALLEIAISVQKKGVLPVFIVTEMKSSWEHAKTMGLQFEEVKDTEGNVVSYKGDFIYVDRGSLNTIEDVAAFIADLMNEQSRGNLPYDLCFLWDSIGSIPCRMSVESNKNSNEWNAGAMSTQFGNFINQKIVLSRKESSAYTNTLVAVNKIWVAKPMVPMEQPKMKNKNGETMYSDASLVVTFGNITNAGTSKIKATKNGKEVIFAKRTKVSCDKNHITGMDTKGSIIATIHGFIKDDKKEIETYKKKYSDDWLKILGSDTFDVVEEKEMKEDIRDIIDQLGND
jgi:hypothetical protein